MICAHNVTGSIEAEKWNVKKLALEAYICTKLFPNDV